MIFFYPSANVSFAPPIIRTKKSNEKTENTSCQKTGKDGTSVLFEQQKTPERITVPRFHFW